MINVAVGDNVLFTNDLFFNRKIGRVEDIYLKGTCGENYKIKSEDKFFSVNVNFVITKI